MALKFFLGLFQLQPPEKVPFISNKAPVLELWVPNTEETSPEKSIYQGRQTLGKWALGRVHLQEVRSSPPKYPFPGQKCLSHGHLKKKTKTKCTSWQNKRKIFLIRQCFTNMGYALCSEAFQKISTRPKGRRGGCLRYSTFAKYFELVYNWTITILQYDKIFWTCV